MVVRMHEVDRHRYSNPTLMRSARGAYAQAMRAELEAIGIDDLPRNGGFTLVGIDSDRGPRHDLPAELGVTKQAVSQALDVLVRRGYLARGREPSGGSAYLFVADADALYAEWSRAGVGGETHPVEATSWGMREGLHADPDGNVIRFGSVAPS